MDNISQMTAFPIGIPGASSRMMSDVMSPHSMASPLSMSSPYSAHSSLSGASNLGQTLASSFATSVASNASALSPTSECDGLEQASSDGDSKVASMSSSGGASAASKKHKPHGCDVCGASFARKVHLQRHSLRHQVCKPYCCERCGKCFSRQDSLVRHHRLLHEKIKEKPKKGSGVGGKKKKDSPLCVRCSNLGVKCDGRSPCGRCSTSEHNAQQCTYKTMLSSASEKRGERRQSMSHLTSNSTSSSFGDEEEEDMMSIAEESVTSDMLSSFGNGHGPRRYTVSNMENLAASSMNMTLHGSFPRTFDDGFYLPSTNWSTSQAQNPHPFEMPQLESMTFTDAKSLHPQQLHQHLPNTQAQHNHQSLFPGTNTHQGSNHVEQDMPLLSLLPHQIGHQEVNHNTAPAAMPFDWTSLMDEALGGDHHNAPREALPFSKSASDESLNVTLSCVPEVLDNSCFPSPAIFPAHKGQLMTATDEQQQQQFQQAVHAATTASAPSAASATVNLASLGLPVPANLNISVPTDLQMSAENWDNLMRCLTSMATRQIPEASKS